MHDPRVMFERQARWQTSRATLSWTEKLRLAATLRDAAIAMRSGTPRDPRRPTSQCKALSSASGS